MKKITLYLMATCLSLSLFPAQSNAAPTKVIPTLVVSTPFESPEAKALVVRLGEINAMDKSALSRSEKKILRREVNSIKKNLNDNYGGVYISVGGLILVLLLLIILL
jgi:hypothetical protein